MTSPRVAATCTNRGGRFWALSPEFLPATITLKIMQKHPLDSKRLRRVPSQFSWVDHRLVRTRLLSGTDTCSWALYLFLVTVGDEQGLSYYSARTLCEHLDVEPQTLSQARGQLLERGLIAWRSPLYQVLDLESLIYRRPAMGSTPASSAATSVTAPAAVSPAAGREESLRLARKLEQILKGGAQ